MMVERDERTPAERELSLGLIGGTSIWHWVIVLVVVVLLFGRGKISGVMGDFAKGIKSFKRNLADDEPAAIATPGERAPGAPLDPVRDRQPTQTG
jgi:sec-independent protein translocase protein TatA